MSTTGIIATDDLEPSSVNSQLATLISEIEKLRLENDDLQKDKSILEEIINEKDKLINNLQLQVDNLRVFSNSLKSPVSEDTPIGLPPRSAQRQFRSISNPVKRTNDIQEARTTQKPEAFIPGPESHLSEGPETETAEEISEQAISVSLDETITENTAPDNESRKTETERVLEDIPQRNPNHRIPPITLEEESPAKSVASSNYSSVAVEEGNAINDGSKYTSRTPTASPTRPSAQQAAFMGIPLSDMVWGSPQRNISPQRNRNPPLSPLKNQLFNESSTTINTPNLNDAEEDEFVFSPIGVKNGSSTTIVKVDQAKDSPTESSHPSITSSDHFRFENGSQNNSTNDLNNVVQYMDQKLNPKENKVRSRASTASSVMTPRDQRRQQQQQQPPPPHVQQRPVQHQIHTPKYPERTAPPSLNSLKAPSESNLLSQSNNKNDINPFDASDAVSFKSPSNYQNVSTPVSRNVSTPVTISSNRFDNFDEEDLKGLMVRPHDLETTLVAVVSVIDGAAAVSKKKVDDPSITFGCFLVEKSGERREIFKFSKTYSQLLEFDSIVRPHFFELLPLPEVSSFVKTTPNTVEFRRQILNNYFYKLYELKIKPKDLSLAICRFVSTDPVFKFDFNENIVKEGFMLRKGTAKLNSSWKISFCSIFGTTLELVDASSNKKQTINISESKLINEEDTKDVRYGISIVEPRKNVLSSSYNRITLCAESNEDKVEWLEALAKASSSFSYPNVKSSSESMLSVPSGADMSPDTSSLRYNNSFTNSKMNGSPTASDAPATPMAQSHTFDDASTLNSVTKPRRRGGLFGLKKDKSAKNNSPDRNNLDDMITPSTAIEPVTNLESYQYQQQQQQQLAQQPEYVLPSATESAFTFSPYSPSSNFSSGPELFGASLEAALELSSKEYKGRVIPSICYRCIDYLEQKQAIYSEGIFRLTGKSSEINVLNEMFNRKYDVDFAELEKPPDIDSISTLLKRYLRSLKESVITPDLVASLKQAPSEGKPYYYKQQVARLLPKINFDLLYILLSYLIKVIKNKEFNKMDINNITMLFSVNFNVDEDVLSELIIDFEYIFNDAPSHVPIDSRPFLRR